jgi:hypothetical protein
MSLCDFGVREQIDLRVDAERVSPVKRPLNAAQNQQSEISWAYLAETLIRGRALAQSQCDSCERTYRRGIKEGIGSGAAKTAHAEVSSVYPELLRSRVGLAR